jgi:hypothetical protein
METQDRLQRFGMHTRLLARTAQAQFLFANPWPVLDNQLKEPRLDQARNACRQFFRSQPKSFCRGPTVKKIDTSE